MIRHGAGYLVGFWLEGGVCCMALWWVVVAYDGFSGDIARAPSAAQSHQRSISDGAYVSGNFLHICILRIYIEAL